MSVADDCSFFNFSHDITSTERRYVVACVKTCYSTKQKKSLTLKKYIICLCLALDLTDIIYLDKNLNTTSKSY